MAYDLEEQEKIASLKAWWDRYGNALTSIALGIAVAVAGYNVWQWYQRDQVAKASGAYDELQRAVAAKDMARVRESTGALLDKYGSTAYAQMGALLAAKTNVDGGDAKTAKAQLQWTVDHAIDPEYRALARLRLAGLLLDDGAYDDAQKQVASSAAADLSAPFQASFADRRGDIDTAADKLDDARREYAAALALLEVRGDARGYANVVQMKLDGLLGGVVSSAPSAGAPAGATAPRASPLSSPAATPSSAPAEPPPASTKPEVKP